MALNLESIQESLMDIDCPEAPKIEEIPENTYICDACGTLIEIDPYLTYPYDECHTLTAKSLQSMRHWHSRYPFSKEVKPGHWLSFCRRVCEIKYERQNEEDWEFPVAKK